ncbi:Hypothetical protein GLP15_3117 [Giardia lamblia P15]|uniref:Uncharacterized protein n=1 Tax=Giardia intestinalis (strain P15) TaxID=658858 RepID=E1F2R4_GIAIA|nr:Hypothetical protein GLP15_3117 [Giardia lamblia P15]
MKPGGPKYISDNAALNDLQRVVGAQTSLSASQTIVALIWKHVLMEGNASHQELNKYTFFKHDRSVQMPHARLDLDYLVKRLHTYILDQRDISIQRLCTVTSAMFSVGALLGIQSDTPASQLLSDLRSSPGVRAWVALLCSLIIGFSPIHSTKLMTPSRLLVGLSRGVAELVSTLDILQAELAIPSVKELSLPADAQKVLLRIARVYSNHELRTAQVDALTFMTEPFHDMALSVRILLIALLLASETEEVDPEKQSRALAALKNALFYSVMSTIPISMQFTMRVFLQQGLLRFCLSKEFIGLFLDPRWIEDIAFSTMLFRYIISFYLPCSSSTQSVEELVLRALTILTIVREDPPSSESVSLRTILSVGFSCENKPNILCDKLLKYICIKLCKGISQASAQKEIVTYLAELYDIYTFSTPLSACNLPTKAPPFATEIATGNENIKCKYQTLGDSINCLLDLPVYWLSHNNTRFVFLNFIYLLLKHNETEGANMLMHTLLSEDSLANIIPSDHFKLAYVTVPWLIDCDTFRAIYEQSSSLCCIDKAVFPTLDSYSRVLEESINSSDYQFVGRIIANLFFAPYCQEALSLAWDRLSMTGFTHRKEMYSAIMMELSSFSTCARKVKQCPSYLATLSGIECKRNFYYVTLKSFIEQYLISVLCLTNCSGVMLSIASLPVTSLILVHEYVKSRLELADIRSLLCGIILLAHPLVQEFYTWLVIQSVTDECLDDVSLNQQSRPGHHLSRESGWLRGYYRNYVSVAVRLTIHVDWTISKTSSDLSSQYLLANLMRSLKFGSLPAMYCLREFVTHLMDASANAAVADMSSLAESLLNGKPSNMLADTCIQSIGESSLLCDTHIYSIPEPLVVYLLNPDTFLPLLQTLPNGTFWKWAMMLKNVSTYEQTSELVVSTVNELLYFVSTLASREPKNTGLLERLCSTFNKAQCTYLPHIHYLSGLYFMTPPPQALSPASNIFLTVIWNTFRERKDLLNDQLEDIELFNTEDLKLFSNLSVTDINELVYQVLLPFILYSTQRISTICAFVCGKLITKLLDSTNANTNPEQSPLSFITKLFMQLIVALSFSTRQNSTKVSRSFPYILSFLGSKSLEEVSEVDARLLILIVILFYSLVKVFETTQAQFVLLGIERCTDILKTASPILFKRFVYKVMSMCDDDNNSVYIKAFNRLHLSDISEGEHMSKEDMEKCKEKILAVLEQTYGGFLLANNLTLTHMLDALLKE